MSLFNPKNDRERQLEAIKQDRLRTTVERSLRPRLEKEFRRLANSASKMYEQTGSLSSTETTINEHRQNLTRLLTRAYAITVNKSTEYVRKEAKKVKKSILDSYEYKEALDRVQQLLNQYIVSEAVISASNISETSWSIINDTIKAGMGEALSSLVISDNIEKAVSSVAPSRALTISRTETQKAAQEAAYQTINEIPLPPMVKVWSVVVDKRARKTHLDLRNVSKEMDENFKVGNDSMPHPAHSSGSPEEVINCRCTLTYDFKE